MKLIIGLGNPGSEYATTRHNVGFMVVNQLAGAKKWAKSKGAAFHYVWLDWRGERVELVKPQLFMNRSGQVVSQIFHRYDELDKLAAKDLYIVHDDLDLELGRFKVQLGTGPKQHNGLLSIYDQLGTDQFWHVRVGVDGRHGERQLPGRNYLLQSFLPIEQPILTQTIEQVADELKKKITA